MKAGKQGSEYYWTEINQMIQKELISLGEPLDDDGDFGPSSCRALEKYIGPTDCGKVVSLDQIEKFQEKVK